MKRTGVIISAIVMLVALALPSLAAGPDWPTGPNQPPAHAHMLELPTGECIDLGANQTLPRNSQHAHMHVGEAGDSLKAAGFKIIPTAPIDPDYLDCADYLART